MDKINLVEKFSLFNEHWSPKIVGELNGQQVKLAKFKGEFVFHLHENEDELFMVIKGKFKMEFRDETVEVNEGEGGKGVFVGGKVPGSVKLRQLIRSNARSVKSLIRAPLENGNALP